MWFLDLMEESLKDAKNLNLEIFRAPTKIWCECVCPWTHAKFWMVMIRACLANMKVQVAHHFWVPVQNWPKIVKCAKMMGIFCYQKHKINHRNVTRLNSITGVSCHLIFLTMKSFKCEIRYDTPVSNQPIFWISEYSSAYILNFWNLEQTFSK